MNPRLLYFVVASAAASVLQGENQTQTTRNHTSDAPPLAALPTATMTTLWTPSHPNLISPNPSDGRSNTTFISADSTSHQTQGPSTKGETTTPGEQQRNSVGQKTATPAEDSTTVSATSPSVATEAAPPVGFSSSVWGIILLVLLLLVIAILVVILYLLRRESRRYSFDLRAGNPDGENTGNFEALSLNDRGGASSTLCQTPELWRSTPKGRETTRDHPVSMFANGLMPGLKALGSLFLFPDQIVDGRDCDGTTWWFQGCRETMTMTTWWTHGRNLIRLKL
ncbi:uncharacterized protein LOC144065384 isoform X2 [Stigmatopora argus]